MYVFVCLNTFLQLNLNKQIQFIVKHIPRLSSLQWLDTAGNTEVSWEREKVTWPRKKWVGLMDLSHLWFILLILVFQLQWAHCHIAFEKLYNSCDTKPSAFWESEPKAFTRNCGEANKALYASPALLPSTGTCRSLHQVLYFKYELSIKLHINSGTLLIHNCLWFKQSNFRY